MRPQNNLIFFRGRGKMGQGKWKIESGKLKIEKGKWGKLIPHFPLSIFNFQLIFNFPLSISDHSSSNVCEPISVPPAKMSTR